MISNDSPPIIQSVRFDAIPQAFRKPHRTKEGWLYADAIFARDGVLTYYRQDGTRHKELRTSEENEKKHTLYGLVPLTHEHPPKLLTSQTAKQYTTGMTTNETAYDKGGFVRGSIVSFDGNQIDQIEHGDAVELSAGYTCVPAYRMTLINKPGVWRGERYDSIQELHNVNHVCSTRKGRAGANVRVLLDSYGADPLWDFAYHLDMASSDPNYQPQTLYYDFSDRQMSNTSNPNQTATVNIDSISYTLDTSTAQAVNAVISRADSLAEQKKAWEAEKADMQKKIDALTSKNEELTVAVDECNGKSDAFESYVDTAKPILESLGYEYKADSQEFICYSDNLDMDDQDIDLEEDDEDTDGDKSNKKTDSVGDLVASVSKAQQLNPQFAYDPKLDSISSIYQTVLKDIDPNFDAEGKEPSYIQGWFDKTYSLMQDSQQENSSAKNDSQVYVDELNKVLDNAANQGNPKMDDQGYDIQITQNWQKPINSSK